MSGIERPMSTARLWVGGRGRGNIGYLTTGAFWQCSIPIAKRAGMLGWNGYFLEPHPMTDEKPRVESETLGGLTQVLEKVSDIQFALILLTAFLAADIGLIVATGRNALTQDWANLNAASFSTLALIFLAYVCWMAILSRVMRALIEMLVVPCLRAILPKGQDSSSYKSKLSYGKVPILEAKKAAFQDGNEFWIKRVDTIESEYRAKKRRAEKLGDLLFSTVCLVLVDLLLMHESVAGELISEMQSGHYLFPLAALCVFAIICFTWLYQGLADFELPQTWIDHPVLASELLRRREENFSLNRTFEIHK